MQLTVAGYLIAGIPAASRFGLASRRNILSADAGYFSEDNVKRCGVDEVMPDISGHRERRKLPWDQRFKS